MIRFSLSRPNRKVLPDTVQTASGSVFSIAPGFRNILRILRMLDDPEILASHKPALLQKWFYTDDAPDDAMTPFYDFLTGGEKSDGRAEKTFCFEFDAPEIYSAFWQEYGIDLLKTDLHWYQFRMLLTGCIGGENALARKLRLRNLDTSKYENRAELEQAKSAVQIPTEMGRTEQKLNEAITDALRNGEDISELLKKVKKNGRE